MAEQEDSLNEFLKMANGKAIPEKDKKEVKAPAPGEVATVYMSRAQEAIERYGFGGPKELKKPDTEIVLVRDLKHAKDVMDECRSTKVCFLDVETSGLDVFDDWVVTYQVTPRAGLAYYFPLLHEGFDANLDPEIAMGMMADLFQDPSVLFGGHQFGFDLKWWKKMGYKLPKAFNPNTGGGYRDSMVEAFITDENRTSGMGLKEIVAQLFGVRMIKFKELGIAKRKDKVKEGQIPHFGFLNIMRAMEYACPDPDYSYRLDQTFMPIIKQSRYRHVFTYLDNPLVAVILKMELRGMAVDREYLQTLVDPHVKRIEEHAAAMKQLAADVGYFGPKDKKGKQLEFNVNSPVQQCEVLKMMGVNTGKMTTGGKNGDKPKRMAIDAEVIKKLAPTNPFLKHLKALRDDEKTLGTYVLPLLGWEWSDKEQRFIEVEGHVNKHTKRVHTSFNQTVVLTGRLSSSDPNLQNVPKKAGILIRKAFIPAPGMRFVRMDYSQIELKILAHISNCQLMIDSFNKGKDFHSVAAVNAFKLDDVDPEGPYVYGDGIKKHPKKEYKLLRDKAKAVNFGIVYGISDKGLSIQLECPRPEAKDLISRWFSAFPEVQEWIQKTIRFGRENGFVETMLCRRRRFVKDEHGLYSFGAERQMQNAPIQGTNADMTKRSMVEIDRKFEEMNLVAGLVCQIHDELISEAPHAEVETVIDVMKTTMEEGLTWFGKTAEASGKPNPYLLATGCSVDFEVQKAWMVTVKKCPHCGLWDGEEISESKESEWKCATCEAVFQA